MTLDCSGREALDDLVRPFYLLEGRNVPDFRNSIGAQYGEFLGNGDNVGKLLEGNILRCVATRKGPYTLSLSVAYFHERRSLNNFHRDRVITFEQIAE